MEGSLNKEGKEPQVEGSIVVIAKCPIPGHCKTRLIPSLGLEGSATLAKAMLADVLETLSNCSQLENVTKILLYAPGSQEGLTQMRQIILSLDLEEKSPSAPRGWILLPLISPDLKSSDIGSMLADALQRTRALVRWGGGVVYLGMDAPELPLEEIVFGLRLALEKQKALLCPADDGGYGMLCVPSRAPPAIFDNILWSCSLTAVSQLKALSDHQIDIVLGKLMHDIDEPKDVHRLSLRLCQGRNMSCAEDNKDLNVLLRSSALSSPVEDACHCRHTWEALLNVGSVQKRTCTETGSDIYLVKPDCDS